MGNTLPITAPPKPSDRRAVIFMEAQGIKSYLKEPWRVKPIGKLQIVGSTDVLPQALDGVVPLDEYIEMMSSVGERAANYRGKSIVCIVFPFLFFIHFHMTHVTHALTLHIYYVANPLFIGGRVAIGVALFHACMLVVVMIGFFMTRYNLLRGQTFFNPITLGVLGPLEFGVISQSHRLFQREEKTLSKELLELLRPWRQEYGIIAKMRRVRGQITSGEGGGEQKQSSTYYCLLLEKMGPDHEADTMSLSTFTGIESEVESDVESEIQLESQV